MSLYVQWINTIKTTSDESWLTEQQLIAYRAISSRWLSVPFVCLWGEPGSGKTFVARLLVKHHGYDYAHTLSELPEGSSLSLYDDAEYTRLTRVETAERNLKRVVLIMRRPPRDVMPCVELKLTDRDVEKFRANLRRHKIVPTFNVEENTHNLERILCSEALSRG